MTIASSYAETYLPQTLSGSRTDRLSIAKGFARLAVLYGLWGMSLGMYMGTMQDFTMAPAHAHINLLGWVSTTLFALVYRTAPAMAEHRLAYWHFGFSSVGAVVMAVLMPPAFLGVEWAHSVVGLALVSQVIGMILFAVLVYRRF